jgi:CRP/FNR family transcriptional regulator, cyclic AMP receptor protein
MAENQLFDKYGRTLPAGKVIFKEGDTGDVMYIIQSGTIRISKTIDGREHVLADLTKGDFFGEMAIVSQIERSANATTLVESHVLAFDRNGFVGMIEKNAKIALNIIDKLGRRLQHANSQIQHLFKKNEQSLIALNLYYQFVESDNPDAALTLDRTADEISLELEVPVSFVKEAFEEFSRNGIVQVQNNSIRLRDRGKLKSFADELGEVEWEKGV